MVIRARWFSEKLGKQVMEFRKVCHIGHEHNCIYARSRLPSEPCLDFGN